MKPIKITLIVLSLIFVNALKAQDTNANSIDSLKHYIINFFYGTLPNNTIGTFYHNTTYGGHSSINLTGKGSVVDNCMVFPTEKGTISTYFWEAPSIHILKYKEPSANGLNVEVATLYLGDWYIVSYVKGKRKEYGKRRQDAIENIEKFERCWNLLAIKTDSIAYDKFIKKYNAINTAENISRNETVSEEQRKFIVQANSWNDKKEYKKALEFYNKAIEVNEFSYPEAYFNMALISGELKYFSYAVSNMKKYLLLVPDASDARAAQDKIYEWEAEY